MGSLIDFLTSRGVGEWSAKVLALLLLAVVMGSLIASVTFGYDLALRRAG